MNNNLNDNQNFNFNVNNQPLSQKEIKKLKKIERKKKLKAYDIFGTHYIIVLLLTYTPVTLLLMNPLKGADEAVRSIVAYVGYIFLPLIGAYLLKCIHYGRLKNFITKENYKEIRRSAIVDLVLLGFFHIGINIGAYIIPIALSYVLSCIYLIYEMDKIYKLK